MKKLFTINNLTSLLFYFAILVFIIGFNFRDAPPPSGWYQQFMPNLGGRQISDIFFLDSLTGWAVTPFVTQNDTTYVLKTTNGGDNWFIQFTGTGQFVGRNRIYFINTNTGFTCGNDHFNGSTKITKTTNGGYNWFSLNDPTTAVFNDMSILNEDTMWLVSNSSFSTGGVFFTSNGGQSWTQQFSGGTQNPNHIYMFNRNIGFITNSSAGLKQIYTTSNSGQNWTLLNNNESFTDIYFIDSLTGFRSYGTMKKTTDGGFNWQSQIMPHGGNIITSTVKKFSSVNRDTLWSNGGEILWNTTDSRDILYRTTNGGQNWLFQIPDTSMPYRNLSYITFTDKMHGWSYALLNTGVHTVCGGSDTFYTRIKEVSKSVPVRHKLFQNYPNPFNPQTNINYEISKSSFVKLVVYDIAGKEVKTLVDQNKPPGEYKIEFDGSGLSSGVYFYSLTVDGKVIDTKRMVLLK